VFIQPRTQWVPGVALLQGSGPLTLLLRLGHLGSPSRSCAHCSSGEQGNLMVPPWTPAMKLWSFIWGLGTPTEV